MSYTTITAVKSVLSGTDTEESGTAAELSDDQIQYEVDSVEADIDSTLRNMYLVPFDVPDDAAVPQIIRQIATDISAYACDLNYRKGREYDNQNMPVPLRYQRAQTLLENLRTGTITLDWPRVADTSGAGVVHQYSPALMTFGDVFHAHLHGTNYPFNE